MIRYLFVIVLFYLILSPALFSQSGHIDRLDLVKDTATYSSNQEYIYVNNIRKTWFYYTNDFETFEIRVFLKRNARITAVIPSKDFQLMDSLLKMPNYTRFKVKFNNLTQSEMLRFTFEILADSIVTYEEIHLQALTNTSVWIRPADDQLFIGEEKSYEVGSNNLKNLNVSNEWVNTVNCDYRFTSSNDLLYLHIVPKQLGDLKLSIPIRVSKPALGKNGKPEYTIKPLEYNFAVKASRLQFLAIDRNEITLSEKTRSEGIEIQLENSRLLTMQKTYRLEAQEDAGGALIAEIYTKQRLANNKVLCIFRPYNFHRSTDGYLYIKDGDNSQFITNVSITPETHIERISILQEGNEWRETNNIHPGETFDLKIEGIGLHKAQFHFEDLINLTSDTLLKSENELVFKLKAPINISKKKLSIYNYATPTGHKLNVVEFQRPRELDFVFVNYGDFGRRVSGIKEPILYDQVIRDLVISFNPTSIDGEKLYGKQYLKIKIQITGKQNELIELKTLENIAICPSGTSPRGDYYNIRDCFTGDISLNKNIRKPTYTLDDWSRINIVISHDKSKYGGEGYEKEIEIILKRKYSFDVEVSFPAGLLTIYPKDTTSNIASLSGISMAMIAQFSFYHPDKINTYRPYKIGAGFLALNAFNMSEGMDLSIVVLGSVYPTTKDVKLTFPLYLGFGYSLSNKEENKAKSPAERFFFLFGPGIRVRF